MDNLREVFEDKHLKLTKPRVEIYNFIKTHSIHPTASAVYKAVQKRLPGVSLATVYNVLNKFVEVGLLKEFKMGDEIRFDGNTTPHIHFVCLQCGKIEDAECKESKKIIEVAQKEGWDVKEFSLFIYGICPECKRKSHIK